MRTYNTYIFGKVFDRATPWTAVEIDKIGKQARARIDVMRNIPREHVFKVLAETGKLFADRKNLFRKTALRHLRKSICFSPVVIEKSLDTLSGLLDRHELSRRMDLELFLPYAMETPVERRNYDGLVRAVPKGVVLHVGAGNVFLGIIDSLILGLLTRNVNLVKTSTAGSHFAVLFAQALKKCDPKGLIADSISVMTWPGGQTELENAILGYCDAVFVWGGTEAVQAYRKLAPAGTHVTGFGPKISLGIATEDAVKNDGMASIAEKIARDVSLWDQSACASPHTLYFICPDRKKWDAVLGSFAIEAEKSFRKMQKELPQGKMSPDEKVEITKARQLAKVDEALGCAFQKSSFPRTHWTVICEKTGSFRISPLNRVLYAKCAVSLEKVRKNLLPYRGYAQSVGVAGTLEDRKKIATLFAPLGIARVTCLGEMLSSVTGSPHDGTFPMRELVSWIGIEGRPSAIDRISELAEFAAAKSPFYRRHLAKAGKIGSMRDFENLPLLDKGHILANTPPDNHDMMTAPLKSGIYFASGGSTGNPKYIFYDTHEYEKTCRMLGYAMEAGGLGENDLAANLFVAGNLWSSWLSVEKALAYTKAVSVPVGSSLPMETVLEYLEEFRVTAAIGLPSYLLKLAQAAQEAGKNRNISLRRIFYGGEYVGPAMTAYFGKVFPGVMVRSAAYATVDAGVVGFQCECCKGPAHHLFDAEQHMEILDLGTLKPVSRGKTGELVVTCLGKRHMPIIRFRMGDLGRWVDKPCGCGRKEPVFEILGRCDDRIHAGGAHIFINDLHNAITRVSGLSFNFQITVSAKGPMDFLKLRVETGTKDAVKNAGLLKKCLLESIRKNCKDLACTLDHGWMDEPEIEILPPGAIERVARTGKIKRV
ncbi:MAG: aldehyde dehydrogenase family protein, partial [bacterium]